MGLAEIIVGLVALLAVAFVAVIALRRLLIARAGGVDVIWRRSRAVGAHGWALGQAQYRRRALTLYRSFSPLPFAALTMERSSLSLGEVRSPDEAEQSVLPAGVGIVTASTGSTAVEIALSGEALMALRSWVESRPPGLAPGPRRGRGSRHDGDGKSPGSAPGA